MQNKENSVKNRVLHAAQTFLDEKEIDTITSRDIARRAGVGLGSINYHFKSRDELLAEAVQVRFRAAAEGYRNTQAGEADPKAALAQQMDSMLRMLLRFGDTARFVLRHKMTNRTFTAERHMLKFISRYYEGCTVSPLEQKLKAMQLSAVATAAFFNREEFYRYADIDLCDAQDAARFARALVDSVLNKPEGDEYEKKKA